MSVDDLEILRRAHDLFTGPPQDAVLAVADRPAARPSQPGQLPAAYLDTAIHEDPLKVCEALSTSSPVSRASAMATRVG